MARPTGGGEEAARLEEGSAAPEATAAPAATPNPARRRRRRRRLLLAIGLPLAVAIAWTPAVVALAYRFETSATATLARPDRGWIFLYDSVRLSRDARLGEQEGAEERALAYWGGSVRARSVRLAWVQSPLTVPVAAGGVAVPETRRTVRLPEPLVWVVTGSVDRRPRQVIGLLDLSSGAAVWDIRQHLPPAGR